MLAHKRVGRLAGLPVIKDGLAFDGALDYFETMLPVAYGVRIEGRQDAVGIHRRGIPA